jgi:hypothetical protein
MIQMVELLLKLLKPHLRKTTSYLAIRVGDSYGGRDAAIIVNNYSVSDK